MSVPTSFLHTFPAAPVAPPSPLPFAPDPSVLQQDNLRVEYNLGELRRATRANLRTLIALEASTAPPRRQHPRHSPYSILPAVPEGLRRRPGNPDSDIGRSLLFHTLDHPHTRRQVEDYCTISTIPAVTRHEGLNPAAIRWLSLGHGGSGRPKNVMSHRILGLRARICLFFAALRAAVTPVLRLSRGAGS